MRVSQSGGVAVGQNIQSRVVELAKAYLELTKPRIATLLLFTAYCAMIVAEGRVPTIGQTVVVLGGLFLSSGGAAAINMWFDRDIDGVMQRTAHRPIPAGVVDAKHALWLGALLGALSVIVLAVGANPLTAALSLAGYLYYAVVYTMWLKRRTPQNIVIGGGAGSFPPLVGWAAVTGHLSVAAWLLAAIIFLWTPSHFWGLALYKSDDYQRAGVPMMPVVRGERVTKRQMVIYAIVLTIVSIGFTHWIRLGGLYAVVAVALNLLFLITNIRLWLDPDGQYTWARRTFFASLLYLPALFTAAAIFSLV